MSNQANAAKMSEDGTKQRKTAKTDEKQQKPAKRMSWGPNHRARGMARSCPWARRPISRFSI